MPIAVRATSGHSVNLRVELKPELIMRKLTLKTAWLLKGAYHVTSPSHLMSILKHGIVPGGERQRRLMSFFGVFPPWDERNRVTRTRSPNEGDVHMWSRRFEHWGHHGARKYPSSGNQRDLDRKKLHEQVG